MRSIRALLLLMAVTTTVLTTALATLGTVTLLRLDRANYDIAVDLVILAWQQREDYDLETLGFNPQGYIVEDDGHIIYTYPIKTTACRIDDRISQCIEDVATIPTDGRTILRDGTVWYEFRKPLRNGMVAIARIQPLPFGTFVRENVGYISALLGMAVVGATPVALLLSLITGRSLTRRFHRIAETSRAFARGDLSARTGDATPDEIGMIGQQFDHMATTISGQMGELRHLAEQNSALAVVAEQHARAAERATLSRDLHDSVSQHLFSLAMGTADLAERIRRSPAQAAVQAEQLAAIAAHAQDELRAVLTQLRPTAQDGRGLIESLHELAHEWEARNGTPVQTRFALRTTLPLLVENALYRAAQEGLNNVARHAAAQRIELTLAQDDGTVRLVVCDDGRGFVPDGSTSGLGLIGMRERLRAIGGTLHVESTTRQGTTLMVSVPVTHAKQPSPMQAR